MLEDPLVREPALAREPRSGGDFPIASQVQGFDPSFFLVGNDAFQLPAAIATRVAIPVLQHRQISYGKHLGPSFLDYRHDVRIDPEPVSQFMREQRDANRALGFGRGFVAGTVIAANEYEQADCESERLLSCPFRRETQGPNFASRPLRQSHPLRQIFGWLGAAD